MTLWGILRGLFPERHSSGLLLAKTKVIETGHLTLTRMRGDEITNVVTSENVLCSAGLSIMSTAIAWAGIQDQAVNLGLPTTGNYMTPLYGAVGNGNGIPASTDIKLFTETSRQITSGGSGLSSAVLFQFFFPAQQQAVTITEAGVFCIGSTATNSGFLLDHALISDVIPAQETSTLQIQLSI